MTIAALVLEVELDRVEPVLRQPTYSSSLPGSDASAPVTWTPLISTGNGLGRFATWTRAVASVAELPSVSGVRSLALARERHPAGDGEDATSAGGRATAARRRRLRRRACVPASAEALVRVHRWVQHGHRVQQCSRSVSNRDGGTAGDRTRVRMAHRARNHPQGHPRCPDVTLAPNPCRVCAGTVPGRRREGAGEPPGSPRPLPLVRFADRPLRGRSTIRGDGALRPRHPAADRGGPDRHRPLRPDADAAVEPRRARSTRLFRVFRNSRYPYIDVKAEQEELTELVEVDGRRGVHPASGRVRPRLDARARHAARRPRRAARGEDRRLAGSAS